jgi:CubicO group peptidase (beta-lactamase class C family)
MLKYLLLVSITLLFMGCSKMTISNFDNLNNYISTNDLKEDIDRLVEPLINGKEDVGIVVSVHKDNNNFTYAYGHKDNFHKKPMQEDTIFGIGSSTKSMVISLLLILDNEGYLSLDETIGDILPKNLHYKDGNIRNITLKELAIHSSGLPREPLSLESLSLAVKYQFTGDNIYAYIDRDYMYKYLSEMTIDKNSKNKAMYSNMGVALLGHVLTLKMNKSLEELLKEYLFEPLDMKNTAFTLNNKQIQMLSEGHVGDFPLFMNRNEPLENWKFSTFMEGTGGLYSNAEDIMKFLEANLGQSNTKLDAILNKSHEILTKDDSLYFTLGWEVQYIPKYDTYIHFKYGVIAGFSCYMGMELKSKTAIVVLKNNFNWEDKIGHQILLEMALSKEYGLY